MTERTLRAGQAGLSTKLGNTLFSSVPVSSSISTRREVAVLEWALLQPEISEILYLEDAQGPRYHSDLYVTITCTLPTHCVGLGRPESFIALLFVSRNSAPLA